MGCPGKDSMQIQDPRARLMVQKQEHREYNLKKQTAVGAGHRTKGGYRCESRSSHLSAVLLHCVLWLFPPGFAFKDSRKKTLHSEDSRKKPLHSEENE